MKDYEAEHARLWQAWLDTKPKHVRELAALYPPGTKFNCHGKIMHTISYDEYANQTAGLGVTEIDPSENYALAVAKKQTVCACCLPKLAELIVK